MKKGFSSTDEKKPAQVSTAEADAAAKPKPKPKKVKKAKENTTPLPVLVELSYTVSIIILILATLSVVAVSIYSGASLMDMVMRTAVTILVVGFILFLISWQIASGTLDAYQIEEEERKKKEEEEKALKEKGLQNENAVEVR